MYIIQIIDQGDIDYLELLSRRTQVSLYCVFGNYVYGCEILNILVSRILFIWQLFALRSQITRSQWFDQFNHDLLKFPPLMWVSSSGK